MCISDFFKFFGKPCSEAIEINILKKILYFLILSISSLILVYGLTIVLQLIIHSPASGVEDLSFLKLVLFGLLLAPIFEELVFRLSLVYSKINLSISASLANTAIITTLLDIRLLTVFGGILFFISFCFAFIFLNNHKSAHLQLEKLWKNNFAAVFYGSAFLFSLFHITNYEISGVSSFLIALLFSVPQLIGALFLGYVRIRLGFLWAVLMHIFFNVVPFGLMVLFG